MYAKITKGSVERYPYSLGRLRADNPQTSFPAEPSDALLAEFGIVPVAPSGRPEVKAIEDVLEADPMLINGVWTQRWSVAAKPLDDAKPALWEATKARRDSEIEAGVAVPGLGTFDSDEKSLANITSASLMALAAKVGNLPFAISWKLADNSVVELDADAMLAAGLAVGQHVVACHHKAQEIGLAVEVAAEARDLEAIDIDAGWPAGRK